jgi:outer membrane protein OmpU
MTNLKKIGLTALAGTLAATTFANAGEVSVSGNAIMEYQNNVNEAKKAENANRAENNSNGYVMNSSLTFSGSGELDNGMTASIYQTLNAGAVTSEGVTLDMGDMGKLSLDSWGYHAGITSIADKVPTAAENVHDDTAGLHDSPAQGVAKIGSDGADTLGYVLNSGNFTISASSSFHAVGSSEESIAVSASLVEGLSIGAGVGTNNSTAAVVDGGVNQDDVSTYYATYTAGPISVGAQKTKIDGEVATTDIDASHYGMSFAVNENMSVSYGERTVEFDSLTLDEESKGISVSYTAGSMTFTLVNNEKENVGGAAIDDEVVELKLIMAF